MLVPYPQIYSDHLTKMKRTGKENKIIHSVGKDMMRILISLIYKSGDKRETNIPQEGVAQINDGSAL